MVFILMNHDSVKWILKKLNQKMCTWLTQATLQLHANCVIKEKQLEGHTWEAGSENSTLKTIKEKH